MKILFICTGNTCRSPMAQVMARDIFHRAGIEAQIDSAGISASEGIASANAQIIMEEMGLDLKEHKSVNIKDLEPRDYDLILTMTRWHKNEAALLGNIPPDRLFTLNEYAGTKEEIHDPYGGDLSVYRLCAVQIKTLLEIAAKKIMNMKEKESMIAIGNDHNGYGLKKELLLCLDAWGYSYKDMGTDSGEAADYPVFARKVVEAVLSGACRKGILICGAGIGISIAANRYADIRAALCHDIFSAKMSRLHNDANILAMGANVIGKEAAKEVIKTFLETDFTGEDRHVRRISLIDQV